MTRPVLATFAIDPGTEQSAWVRVQRGVPLSWAKVPNHDLLAMLPYLAPTGDVLTIEWPSGTGAQGSGRAILDTAAWAGRFLQRWLDAGGPTPTLIKRAEVKRHLLGTVVGTDTKVRRAVLDREARLRGSIDATKGMANDVWQAYALAITHDEVFHPTNRPEGTTR